MNSTQNIQNPEGKSFAEIQKQIGYKSEQPEICGSSIIDSIPLPCNYIHTDDGTMLQVISLRFDYEDSMGNHWFYCETDRGLLHTTSKDIYSPFTLSKIKDFSD